MKPYAILSDQHLHAWSQFSTVDADGVNSRVRLTLDEIERAAKEIKALGGDLLVFAGDLFHVRGSIDPEVFNPAHEMIRRVLASGMRIIAIPGNHDLKGKETTQIGNAIQTLGALDGFSVVTEPEAMLLPGGNEILFMPWCSSPSKLLDDLKRLAASLPNPEDHDVVIHAGINGVIMGMPDHGLDAVDLAAIGFRRIFAGHYHNHKVMEGGKVVSIGATTHLTWNDIGTKAGFIIVHDAERIEYRASRAPSFVEITEGTEEEEIPLLVDGNVVRVRGKKLTEPEVKKLRADIMALGAKGVSIEVAREVVTARTTTVKASTLDESIDVYIDNLALADAAAVKARCAEILASVRYVA